MRLWLALMLTLGLVYAVVAKESTAASPEAEGEDPAPEATGWHNYRSFFQFSP